MELKERFKLRKLFNQLVAHYNGPDEFQVWYSRIPLCYREGKVNLEADYRNLGLIKSQGLEEAYMRMQGEMWSPNGEAREIIRGLGLKHTSMSVGDVLVNNRTGVRHMVAGIGFMEVG